jgi:hypothetical protein
MEQEFVKLQNGSNYIFPVITRSKLSPKRFDLLTKLFAFYSLQFFEYPLSSYRLEHVLSDKPWTIVLSEETRELISQYKPTPLIFTLPDPLLLEKKSENLEYRKQACREMEAIINLVQSIDMPRPNVEIPLSTGQQVIVAENIPEESNTIPQVYLSYDELDKINRLAKLLDEAGDRRVIQIQKKS